ncbi:PspC domain-containing protein [Amphibacillus sp. Q70]|uniref:PspC domain-containing protein n=1 Tax=Amphibacillus sp. Q70 TaxID=3453416 RepID=UPI003F85EB9B
MGRKLRRSRNDKVIFGVCGGIAQFFGISSNLVRVLFFILPSNVIIYMLLALFLTEEMV